MVGLFHELGYPIVIEPPELIVLVTVTAKVALPIVWVVEGLNVSEQALKEPVANEPYVTEALVSWVVFVKVYSMVTLFTLPGFLTESTTNEINFAGGEPRTYVIDKTDPADENG